MRRRGWRARWAIYEADGGWMQTGERWKRAGVAQRRLRTMYGQRIDHYLVSCHRASAGRVVGGVGAGTLAIAILAAGIAGYLSAAVILFGCALLVLVAIGDIVGLAPRCDQEHAWLHHVFDTTHAFDPGLVGVPDVPEAVSSDLLDCDIGQLSDMQVGVLVGLLDSAGVPTERWWKAASGKIGLCPAAGRVAAGLAPSFEGTLGELCVVSRQVVAAKPSALVHQG